LGGWGRSGEREEDDGEDGGITCITGSQGNVGKGFEEIGDVFAETLDGYSYIFSR